MSDISSTHAEAVHVSAVRYARLIHTLRGDVPTVHTVAILTAALGDHRLGKPGMTQQNVRRNADLLHDLATYSTRQIKGRFSPLENPYVVANLPRARLVELGVKYGQDAVIFGCRKGGKRLSMGFEWICTNAKRGRVGNVTATRAMVLESSQALEREETHGTAGSDGDSVRLRAKGTHFVIPFFDEDEAREEGWRGGTMLTYCQEDLPDTPQVQEAVAAVRREEGSLLDSQRRKEPSHCQYTRRGALNNRLRDLHRIMDNWRGYGLPWERTW